MTQSTQKPRQRFLKTQSLKILRGTINLLEGIVERLEAEPVGVPTPTPAPGETTLESTTASNSTPVSDIPTVTPESATAAGTQNVVPQRTKTKLVDWLYPSFQTVQRFWDGILAKVRSLLPEAWNQTLSDWGLTSAIAGILVLILLTTVALLPETPTQIAKDVSPELIEAPAELEAPASPQPIESVESVELAESEESAESVESGESVEAPPPVETPEPTQIELTPEQSLIAGIQKQVAEVTNQYANGLIQSIQANFRGSRLIVKVSEGWYDLAESQQNQLADEILRRAKELDFSKLEITNSEGVVLARSPVVGSHMVILQRQDVAGNF
ncbi:MAG TPA: hypothetical protein DD379_00035 [Cyanobacteria bacterium UBA11162]|nr:hypothetical protein [Cyanobacteria bacterium UBA11162]